ncbi:RadR putative transcriptional regulator [Xylaria palmicola]|nr:RadR putative transcriptional regulator [Xylaria palmicola]
MCSATTPHIEHCSPSNRSGAGHPARSNVPEPDPSASDLDRKTKKRIQNRVAQRTYRSRIKKRLRDLQEQVYQMQQTAHDQQQISHSYVPTEFRHDTDGHISNPMHAHSTDLTDIGHLDFSFADMSALNGTWSKAADDLASGAARQAMNYKFDDTFKVPEKSSPDTNSDATHRPRSHSSTILSLDLRPHELVIRRRNTDASIPTQEDSQDHFSLGASGIFDQEKGQTGRFGYINAMQANGDSWENSVQDMLPHDSARATSARAGLLTDLAENPSQAGPFATVEERFEYVLGCAQRVGFDCFDGMATQYYTTNFSPASALALEQRLSRSRRLPGLLAELRKSSSAWSAWQRRGYEDETLKAAEKICAVEYGEFRKGEMATSETALEETLPNIWALLMRLASSNPLLAQRDIPQVVMMSMSLLCGSGEEATQQTQQTGLFSRPPSQ